MANNTNYISNDTKTDTEETNGIYLLTIHCYVQKLNYLFRLIYL